MIIFAALAIRSIMSCDSSTLFQRSWVANRIDFYLINNSIFKTTTRSQSRQEHHQGQDLSGLIYSMATIS